MLHTVETFPPHPDTDRKEVGDSKLDKLAGP